MAYDTVLYDVTDRICTIALNRPEKLNAWTRQMHFDLKDAMHRAGADPEVRAIILTGSGRGFCAGADMGGLQAIGAGGGTADRSTKAAPGTARGQHPARVQDGVFLLPGDPEIHHRGDQRAGRRPGLRHPALCRSAVRRRVGRVHDVVRPARPDRRARRELAAAAPGRPAGRHGPAVLGPQVPRPGSAVSSAWSAASSPTTS